MNEKNDETCPVTIGARQVEVAVLAGGCFWGVEDLLRDVPGVIDTEVGYFRRLVLMPSWRPASKQVDIGVRSCVRRSMTVHSQKYAGCERHHARVAGVPSEKSVAHD